MATEVRWDADQRPSWGFWKMYHRICKDGHVVNHKRLYRIYSECRLNIRRKPKRRLPKRIKQPLLQALIPNLTWSMGVMRDRLFYGAAFRWFNLIDDFKREALSINVAKSIVLLMCYFYERILNFCCWGSLATAAWVQPTPHFIRTF